MTSTGHPQLAARRRRDVLLLLVGAPTIITALGVTVLEVSRIYRPDARLFGSPGALSLADAIARDDVNRAYEFIRAGEDPRTPLAVEHPTLTGGRRIRVMPLLWAVASGADRSVQMLLGSGAGNDAKTMRQAQCLAEQLGHAGVAVTLRRHQGSHGREPCSRPGATGITPLEEVAWLE